MDAQKRDKIDAILREQLFLDEGEIKPFSSLVDDFEADSIDLVEILMELEGEFDIEIPDEALERIKTVQNLYDYVEERTK